MNGVKTKKKNNIHFQYQIAKAICIVLNKILLWGMEKQSVIRRRQTNVKSVRPNI